jgi:hypothetical protein
MTPLQDHTAVIDRLRRALSAFQAAQNLVLLTHRKLKGVPQADVDAFWEGRGRRVEANTRATAMAVVAAFEEFSMAGLIASASDRHLVNQAQRHLKEGAT